MVVARIRKWRGLNGAFGIVINQVKASGALAIKDRKKGFQTYRRSFVGSELVAWMETGAGFFTKEEAVRYCEMMFESGYLVSFEMLEKFIPDGSLYAFQVCVVIKHSELRNDVKVWA